MTDPPYGVSYDLAWRDDVGGTFAAGRTVMRGRVTNDDRVDWTAAWAHVPGDVAYVWHAALYAVDVAQQLAASGFVWACPGLVDGLTLR